jgi:hypothetical protein
MTISCSKTDKLAEDINPAASSGYSSSVVLKDAIHWIAVDPMKRKIGQATSSGSMLRLFDSRSILLLEKLDLTDPINIGDILGYVNTDLSPLIIAHRLIRVNDGGKLVFRGDNNDSEDPPVKRDAVVWRVAGILYTDGK